MWTDPEITEGLLETVADLGTATISMQLVKRGIRNHWIRGALPFASGQRVAGPAFTVRFIPFREDVATRESYAAPNSLRDAIEAIPEGAVAVFDARGVTDAGTIGDILAMRMKQRGVAGFVSDGAIRDVRDTLASGLPIWANGTCAPPSIGGLFFIGWDEPIGCGGCAVFPGDVIVADDDGAVVVPIALVPEIAADGREQDLYERFVQERVASGDAVKGLYPPNDAALERFAAWRAEKGE